MSRESQSVTSSIPFKGNYTDYLTGPHAGHKPLYNKNTTCFRTLSFSARMSRQAHANLDGFLDEMRHLWNAALEERVGAFRKAGKSITWMD